MFLPMPEKVHFFIPGFLFSLCRGVLFCFTPVLAAYIRMWHLIKSASVYRESGVCWIVTDRQVSPFSWGNYIVMNRKDYEAYPLIRLHEQMHVFYGHSWDSLWMQLLQVFHWFNPVVWLWQKELRDLHEYQADHGVISCGIDVKHINYYWWKSCGHKALLYGLRFRSLFT